MCDKIRIPRVMDIFDNLREESYFTTLDMTKAYHQRFMNEHSSSLTAFTTSKGWYE